MVDAVTLLQEKIADLARKVGQRRTALGAMEAELAELETALKVLARLGLAPGVVAEPPKGGTGTRDVVFDHLSFTEEGGLQPKELHDALTAEGITYITADNVRTILYRMHGKGQVRSKDGKYWRDDLVIDGEGADEPTEPSTQQQSEAEASNKNEAPSSNATGASDVSLGGGTNAPEARINPIPVAGSTS